MGHVKELMKEVRQKTSGSFTGRVTEGLEG